MRYSLFLYIIFISIAYSVSVQAHPHQFVDYKVAFIVNDTALEGVRVDWYVDEMISAWITGDFNLAPGDSFGGEDFTKYMHETFYEVEKNYYFVVARWKGKRIKPYRWQDKKLVITDDGLLHFSFIIPFGIELAREPQPFTFQFIDETFYIAFTLMEKGAGLEGTGASKGSVKITSDQYDDMIIVTLKQ